MSTVLDRIKVEVFNSDSTIIGRVDPLRAYSLIRRRAAREIEPFDPPVLLRSPAAAVEIPRSLVLVRWVYVPVRRADQGPNRSDILRRDGHMCQYCLGPADTIDHVLPKAHGGGDTWYNLAAACKPCNGWKGDRLPEKAGMALIREPYIPLGRR